jgi:hypothetical protein
MQMTARHHDAMNSYWADWPRSLSVCHNELRDIDRTSIPGGPACNEPASDRSEREAMSYYLCIAVPRPILGQLSRYFDPCIWTNSAQGTPIGEATRGSDKDLAAALIQIGSSSAFLVGRGGVKRTHNNDRRALLLDGVRSIYEANAGCTISLLLHAMRGLIATEPVLVREEIRLDLGRWEAIGGELEEDVRYRISTP